jgi:hypothetical protein
MTDPTRAGGSADDMSDECVHQDAVVEARFVDALPGWEGYCVEIVCSATDDDPTASAGHSPSP